MDETMVFYDIVTNATNSSRGKKTIKVRGTVSKRRCTVALTIRASGHKLLALVILKETTGEIAPHVRHRLNISANIFV